MAEAEIVSFGCRLNSFESEIIRDNARNAGVENAIVFNTCAVTSEAQRQARQAIRRAKREAPGRAVIVTGCAAQLDAAGFAAMDEVDLVLGNEEKLHFQTYQGLDFEAGLTERVLVNDIMAVSQSAPQLIEGFSERSRAFVQIQNGCNHRCTFCIIPFGRGNSRSVPAGDVVRQIAKLVENGYNEIVLTGVDITAYGADLPGNMQLGSLVGKILDQVPELKRLRISSIDSVEADEELVKIIETEERLLPHLHLSLQSGDNMILKRMKRRHSREDSIEFCARLKQARPDIVFGADLIAGFPTETEEMFENSLALVDECDLTYLHVFPFSARPDTPAARMPQLDGRLIKQRAARLRKIGDQRRQRFFQNQTGCVTNALVETATTARTSQFAPVTMAQNCQPGAIIDIRITGADSSGLKAELI